MRLSVEAWGPDYGGEIDLGPDEVTEDVVDTECEPGHAWAPVEPRPNGLASLPLGFVDGTRRMDARVFLMDGDSAPLPGVAGSVGVGAVLCDPGGPGLDGRKTPAWWAERRAEIAEVRIDRYLAMGGGRSVSLPAGPGLEFKGIPHPSRDLEQLADSVHERMRQSEAELAAEIASDDRIVFLDGPLAKMRPGPVRVIAFIKAHHRRYLDAEHEKILGHLGCGERTPLFAFGEPRPRYSWYLRLCELDPKAHSWHGLVRCECPSALEVEDAAALADASAALLPAFASEPHWDARAPQNLVPVAGLEKKLRHLLGDKVLVNRMIRSAAARIA